MSTIAIKERPMRFKGPLVIAIDNGLKTQTRREMAHQPNLQSDGSYSIHAGRGEMATNRRIEREFKHDELISEREYLMPVKEWLLERSPYKVGDRLYVAETLRATTDTPINAAEKMPFAAYQADGSHLWTKDRYRVPWRWKRNVLPSIHMPRELSRLTLEITDVRVERLNEISDEDAIAEGCQCAGVPASLTNRGAFAKLWDSINGDGSWKLNPFVWALTFKKVSS